MGKKLLCWEQIENDARPKVRYWVPGAAMDKGDLEQELQKLRDRGFGGVEVVTLGTTPEEIQTGNDRWGTKNWNEMVQVIADTTENLGMSMDLANGPMWPISMPTVKHADDPGALCELTYGVIKCAGNGVYEGPLPKPRTVHEEGTPKLVGVYAYLEIEDFVLKQDSYRNLMENIEITEEKKILKCKLPKSQAGEQWVIFAFYSQPAVHKTGLGQFYVIDHMSREGAKACEEYWDEVLSKYSYPSMESFFCDSLEYCVMMDWTKELPKLFEQWRGYSIIPYLPVVGLKVFYPICDIPGYRFEDSAISDMINRDYFEVLTRCYCENHLAVLEKMAKKYGKSIRYQVAYNKPFEGERCPLFVEIPENEALGRPAMDYQKTMASAVHLGRKKRYSFECAAEFGNGYGQTYDDLFWWIKRSLMSGMNAQVMHGASYSGAYHGEYSVEGHMREVKWPGYDGFQKGISNEWNRTLSVDDARNCLDTVARLNIIFRKKAKVDCAIYRQTYENNGLGSEFCFYPDDGKLMNKGYSYETISPYLLELPVCKVENGILDKDGVGYQCLIVPPITHVATNFLIRVSALMEAGLTVVWVGEKPEHSEYYCEWRDEAQKLTWNNALFKIWNSSKLIHVSDLSVVPDALEKASIYPRVRLEGGKDIVTAVREDEKNNVTYYAMYAYNRVRCTPDELNPDELACSAMYQKGTTKGSYLRPGKSSRQQIAVRLKGTGQVFVCNYWNQKVTPISFAEKDGYMCGKVWMEEDEMILFQMDHQKNMAVCSATQLDKEKIVEHEMNREYQESCPVKFDVLELEEFLPDSAEEISFLRSHFSKEKKRIDLTELKPWRELDDSLKKFAGRGTYFGRITVAKKEKDRTYMLSLGNVQDTFQVWINGQRTEFPDQVLKKVDITEHLQEGINEIRVTVVSNLYNKLQGNGEDTHFPMPIPYVEKDYGIWEDANHEITIKAFLS